MTDNLIIIDKENKILVNADEFYEELEYDEYTTQV